MSIDIFGVASSNFGEHVHFIVSLAKLQTSVFLNEKHQVIYKKVK